MPKIRTATRIFDRYIIFDIKIGKNFRRKARYVADGNKTDTPPDVIYNSVVSRDSIRIILLIEILNDLEIVTGDIENVHLTAPCKEKNWTRVGPEFELLKGEILIIEKELYGLKLSGAAF